MANMTNNAQQFLVEAADLEADLLQYKLDVLTRQTEWLRDYTAKVKGVADFVRTQNRAPKIRSVLSATPQLPSAPTPKQVEEKRRVLKRLLQERRTEYTKEARQTAIEQLRNYAILFENARKDLAVVERHCMAMEEMHVRLNAECLDFRQERDEMAQQLLQERDRIVDARPQRKDDWTRTLDEQIDKLYEETSKLLEENMSLSTELKHKSEEYDRLNVMKVKPVSFFSAENMLSVVSSQPAEAVPASSFSSPGQQTQLNETIATTLENTLNGTGNVKYSVTYDSSISKSEAERNKVAALGKDAERLKKENEELQKTYSRLRRAADLLVDNRKLVFNFLKGLMKEIDEVKYREGLKHYNSIAIVNNNSIDNTKRLEAVSPINRLHSKSSMYDDSPAQDLMAKQNFCCLMRAPDRVFYELLLNIKSNAIPPNNFISMSITEIETYCLLLLENLHYY